MKQSIMCAALAALVLASPAAAEPWRQMQDGPRVSLMPRQVLHIVRSTGLDPLERPMRRGPNYVLRAINGEGREVRVVIGGRFGDILSVTPVEIASRAMPPGMDREFDEAMPDRYVPAPGPGAYRRGPPPIMVEPGPNPVYGPRPPAPILREGMQRPDAGDDRPISEPRVITAIPPGDSGATGQLPPPPDRFQHRPLPPPAAAKPLVAPPKRAASIVPAQPPLPKARPVPAEPAAPAQSSNAPMDADAAPLPPPIPENQPADGTTPH